uniref:Secreted protein n=1 Tax=Panagrellus redivivus TaxID=6233 RepID=A0A7E4VPN3_PANRE
MKPQCIFFCSCKTSQISCQLGTLEGQLAACTSPQGTYFYPPRPTRASRFNHFHGSFLRHLWFRRQHPKNVYNPVGTGTKGVKEPLTSIVVSLGPDLLAHRNEFNLIVLVVAIEA